MSGGQGVASSNLASPTLFALVRADLHPLGRPRISRSFTRISHDPGQSGSEPGGRGPGSLLGAREVGRVVDLHHVPEESRHLNRWYPGSMHHQGQRVADAVEP
jgi:hypothetical protein